MTVSAESEIWSIGSVETVRASDPSESRLLRASFFYAGVASLLPWQVLLCLGLQILILSFGKASGPICLYTIDIYRLSF